MIERTQFSGLVIKEADKEYDRGHKIGQLLANGGFGAVYEGADLERPNAPLVAIKIGDEFRNSREQKEFEMEARRSVRLRHEHVLATYVGTMGRIALAGGEEVVRPFMVMEMAAGGSLAQRLRNLRTRGEKLSIEQAVKIVCEASLGVAYLHGEGITHRDIKPGNILFDHNDKTMIADIGSAIDLYRAADSSIPEQLTIGSIQYMPPEQFNGQAVAESDVYAMGLVLYELLTGERVINTNEVGAAAYQHAHKDPTPFENIPNVKLNPRLRELECCINEAVKKDPKERPSDIKEWAKQLQDVMEGGNRRALKSERQSSRTESFELNGRSYDIVNPYEFTAGVFLTDMSVKDESGKEYSAYFESDHGCEERWLPGFASIFKELSHPNLQRVYDYGETFVDKRYLRQSMSTDNWRQVVIADSINRRSISHLLDDPDWLNERQLQGAKTLSAKLPDELCIKALRQTSSVFEYLHNQGYAYNDIVGRRLCLQSTGDFLLENSDYIAKINTSPKGLGHHPDLLCSYVDVQNEMFVGSRETDIHLLGELLGRLMRGGNAPYEFTSADNFPLNRRVVEDPEDFFENGANQVQEAVFPVMLKSMNRDWQDRYHSAEEFYDAFSAAYSEGKVKHRKQRRYFR